MSARLLALVLITGALLAPRPAHAYVDPGTGSLVIQGIIAAVVGVGLTLRLSWRRIRRLFTGRSTDDSIRDDGSDADQ
ncbi:MAG: hypothetical protein IPH48_12205 [bacterium]|jgi:hypothetical protein|nr:hypothetical protein [bacterium]